MTDVDLAEGGWFGSPVEGRAGLVTLVEGSTFCVAGRSADITPGRTQGLFFLDTRLVSRLELVVDGQPIEPLSVLIEDPFSAVHVGRRRPPPGVSDVPVLVTRRRYVGRGMRDEVTIHNYGPEPEEFQVELLADADFADLFAVKGGRPHPARPREAEVAESGLVFHTRTGRVVATCVGQLRPPPRQDGTRLRHLAGPPGAGRFLEPVHRGGAVAGRQPHRAEPSLWAAGGTRHPRRPSRHVATDRSPGDQRPQHSWWWRCGRRPRIWAHCGSSTPITRTGWSSQRAPPGS